MNVTWTDKTARLVGMAHQMGGPDGVLEVLADNGLLVSADFERPTEQELYDRHRLLMVGASRSAVTARWVMCRETHDHIAGTLDGRKYIRRIEREAMPELGIAVELGPSGEPGRLFGRDIRIDPAARRIMIEVDPK